MMTSSQEFVPWQEFSEKFLADLKVTPDPSKTAQLQLLLSDNRGLVTIENFAQVCTHDIIALSSWHHIVMASWHRQFMTCSFWTYDIMAWHDEYVEISEKIQVAAVLGYDAEMPKKAASLLEYSWFHGVLRPGKISHHDIVMCELWCHTEISQMKSTDYCTHSLLALGFSASALSTLSRSVLHRCRPWNFTEISPNT